MVTHAVLESLRTIVFAALVLSPVAILLIASALASLFPFTFVDAAEIADARDADASIVAVSVARALLTSAANADRSAAALAAYRARYTAPVAHVIDVHVMRESLRASALRREAARTMTLAIGGAS